MEKPAETDMADKRKGKNSENKKLPISKLELGIASNKGARATCVFHEKTIPHRNPIGRDTAREKALQLQEMDLPQK